MTKLELITKFRLFMDDSSELSSAEESDLFDKIYRRINSMLPWEYTKSEGTGTTSTSVAYISLPADFLYMTANANYTDSSFEASRPVVYVGTTFDPYKVISWSDRRSYRNQSGYCYVDFANSRLYFTKQPASALATEFDYHAQQTALTDNDSPVFPAEYHDAIYHYMVAEDFAIQQSDKAKSYAKENIQMAEAIIDDMKYWNSELVQI